MKSKRDALFIEHQEIKNALRGISPNLSIYKDLKRQEEAVLKKIEEAQEIS